jgi:hypothetical protein
MAKIIIEALNTPSIWQTLFRSDLHLRISPDQQFLTGDGQVVFAGPDLYLKVPCSLDGDTILAIESFEIDSTWDSPDAPTTAYTADLYSGNTLIATFVADFGIRSTPANQTWADLILLRDAGFLAVPTPGAYPTDIIDFKIAQALALLRMSSSTQVGNLALDEDPVDPNFPIALSVNSRKVPAEFGSDVLVAEETTTVPSAAVLSTSIIVVTSHDPNINEPLRVSNIVDEVSFDVSSAGGADFGDFQFVIFNP